MDTVLSGERVFFAEGQFSGPVEEILTASVQRLGGDVTPERNSSSILLTNPSSPLYSKEIENIAFLQSNYPNLAQPVVTPYHWLAICLLQSRRVALSDLPSPTPIFTHPDRSRDHAPLRAWVSVNVHRHEGESAEEARASVVAMLESGGALSVPKRAHADLLIVDTSSNFFKTVSAEKAKNGRDWQKLAERDWVESCVKGGSLIWTSAKEEEAGEDSFEDEPVRSGKGPGRPTGKPRVDYTPQDDDFLCRYLAAHHPDGSWHSRKTYQMLVSLAARYPIAERHSDQSWHERFKKNSAPFGRRIERLLGAGVDQSLKTVKEREKAAMQSRTESGKTTAEKEGARLTELALRAMEPADQSAGPSNTRQRAASPLQAVDLDVVVAEQRPAAAIGKRKLVESESEGEAPNPKPAARASTTGRKEPAQDLIAELPTPDAPPSVNDAGALDSLRAHLEPAKSTNFDPDDAAVDQVLLGNESLPDRDSSRHERLAGPETLAILSDFAQARASAQHPDSPATRQQPVHVEQPIRLSPNPARTASMPRSPQKRPRTEVKATHPSPRGTRSPVRPAAELIRSRHSLHDRVADASPRQTGMTRMSIPVRLEFDFRGVTADDPGSSREAARFETPSPAGSRSLLREEIMSNASKRRHALNRGIHKSSPDTVYVSTTIPPLRATPDEARRLHRPRSPSPVLSHAQRSDQILAGQQLVLAVKDQYRARISDLSERYGVRPTELFRLVNELPKSKGGAGSGVYWLDVEEGLKGHFGY